MKMRSLITLALAALPGMAIATTASEPAFEQRCEREMKPRFDVSLSEAGHQVDNTVSSRVLNNKSVHNSAGDFMIGMTALETHTSVLFDGPTLADKATGRECVSPRISVELLVPRMSVYVAREFAPTSCSYRAILEHEMRHVHLYREQFPQVEARVRAGLAARFGDRPLYATHGAGRAALQAEVDQWLRPFIRKQIAGLEVAQAALDTPEETFRLYGACQGELASNLTGRY
ncbi:hypothetical protein ACFSQU_14090 [Massilia sp. GCM10020059]|uniref:DUF922 domain-containing protein n=1 Tax=Massilia agrisoli TaxID=2892444 RepID=A0ABS8IW78_9BURK|nr:hypothetical protein [Massilia agrisoli]MCC6072890.1 hypothetical protein [Massilia agrisoli]